MQTQLCTCILLAEFDIDEGSILRHEYPSATGSDTHLLAELMLPDGVHTRAEDWTVFYLNRNGVTAATEKRQSYESVAKPPALSHVINLVRTKMDNTVRRGAIVKAMAVASPMPYIQIFRPLLLLALDEYFNNQSVNVLKKLYDTINAIELSAMPQLNATERSILRGTDRKDLFEEKFGPRPVTTSFGSAKSSRSSVAEAYKPETPPKENGTPPSAHASRFTADPQRRKESIGSVLSSNSTSNESRTAESTAPTFNSGADSQQTLFMNPTPASTSRGGRDTHFFDAKALYGQIAVPVRIPLSVEQEDVGDYSLITLIQTFSPNLPNNNYFQAPFHPQLHTLGANTPPIMLLLNAILSYKRVIFLSQSTPASHVAQMVLAACSMASGGGACHLRGTPSRAFPYSNLTNRDNHEAVPGYIAGVANPRFEAFTTSWDVFCNIDTGKIIVSKDIGASSMPSPLPTSASDENLASPTSEEAPQLKQGASAVNPAGANPTPPQKATKESYDGAFLDETLALIASHASEGMIRARFADYIARFCRLASRYEEEQHQITNIGWPTRPFVNNVLACGMLPLPDVPREIILATPKIEAWRSSAAYQWRRQDFRNSRDASNFKDIDLHHQLAKLRLCRQIQNNEAEAIYRTLLSQTTSEERILELLSHTSLYNGGLQHLALGLFHQTPQIRRFTVRLLDLISSSPTGGKFVDSLNAFERMAYKRLAAEGQNSQQTDGM